MPKQPQPAELHASAGTHLWSRRRALQCFAATAVSIGTAAEQVWGKQSTKSGCTLGFSTYGMKTLKTEEAVQTVAKTGFDAIEIAVRADWDSSPRNMPQPRRDHVRQLLQDSNLQLVSLMEHLEPSRKDDVHQQQLTRLTDVFELAADWSTGAKPLVQTTLGEGNWKQNREFLRDRVGDWVKAAEKHDIIIAIKPHRGGGMSRPSEAVWLIEQLGKPAHLKMVYDYSHYAYREMPLAETITTALPYTAHIALKDPVQKNGNVHFQLPGEVGTVDFPRLMQLFYAGGYRQDFNCEVSGMVWSKPGYDPVAAAQSCYASMTKALAVANVPRASA